MSSDRMELPALREGKGPAAYGPAGAADAYFWAELRRLLENGAERVCEVGGGAKPAIGPAGVQKRGLEYVVIDESQRDLDEAPEGYRLVRANILDDDAVAAVMRDYGPFD